MFKALLKAYTGDCLYGPIGEKITKHKYEAIQGYLSFVFKTLKEHGKGYSVKAIDKPVYRGINPTGYYKKDDYKVNSIGTWTTF